MTQFANIFSHESAIFQNKHVDVQAPSSKEKLLRYIIYKYDIFLSRRHCHGTRDTSYYRFKGYDYNQGASLFISMAAEPRQNYFVDLKEGYFWPFSSSHSLAFSSPCSADLRIHSTAFRLFFPTP